MTESMAIPLYGLSHIKVTGSPAQWKVAEFKPGDKSFLLTMTQNKLHPLCVPAFLHNRNKASCQTALTGFLEAANKIQ